MKYDVALVGKIGSMALISKQDNEIDYNVFARLGRELHPGIVWVSSGATEIGRIDYMKRNEGKELSGTKDDVKSDYAAQGQTILMNTYRQFIRSDYSVRQILLEHQHINDVDKALHIKNLILRCINQNAIPIINYNDATSIEELRKLELQSLKSKQEAIVECVDNDETAAVLADLLKAETLLILSSTDGIYKDHSDKKTLISEIRGKNDMELLEHINEVQKYCNGTSREGSNGAYAKLEYIKKAALNGTKIIIGNSKYRISDLLKENAPSTKIYFG